MKEVDREDLQMALTVVNRIFNGLTDRNSFEFAIILTVVPWLHKVGEDEGVALVATNGLSRPAVEEILLSILEKEIKK